MYELKRSTRVCRSICTKTKSHGGSKEEPCPVGYESNELDAIPRTSRLHYVQSNDGESLRSQRRRTGCLVLGSLVQI